MTLKIYVAKDTVGREWPPNEPQEVEACEWMLKKAWMEFHHLPELYAVIVNQKNPSADMLVIREIGLGVLELKHHFGEIYINRDGVWMAGPIAIHSGKRLSPRAQVRIYAQELRTKIIHEILPARLQTNRMYWNELKFHTGVCFTNTAAKLQKVKQHLEEKPPFHEPWEQRFSVFGIDSFTTWMRELRFGLEQDYTRNFAPVRLNPENILRVVTKVLGAKEWKEMTAAMPTGKPYGCLVLEDAEGRQVFNLTKDHSTVGRSHECDVVLPDRYSRVSKIHCVISRDLNGITISDHPSRNGTFVNDQPVNKPTKLEHGSILTLGGPSTGKKVCVLGFALDGMISHDTTATEQGTRDLRLDS